MKVIYINFLLLCSMICTNAQLFHNIIPKPVSVVEKKGDPFILIIINLEILQIHWQYTGTTQ